LSGSFDARRALIGLAQSIALGQAGSPLDAVERSIDAHEPLVVPSVARAFQATRQILGDAVAAASGAPFPRLSAPKYEHLGTWQKMRMRAAFVVYPAAKLLVDAVEERDRDYAEAIRLAETADFAGADAFGDRIVAREFTTSNSFVIDMPVLPLAN